MAPALPGAPNQAYVPPPRVLVEATRGMEHDGVVGDEGSVVSAAFISAVGRTSAE
jgi:hypothetical protein